MRLRILRIEFDRLLACRNKIPVIVTLVEGHRLMNAQF